MKEKIEVRIEELYFLISAATELPEDICYGFPEDNYTKSPLAHSLENWENELKSLELFIKKLDFDGIIS